MASLFPCLGKKKKSSEDSSATAEPDSGATVTVKPKKTVQIIALGDGVELVTVATDDACAPRNASAGTQTTPGPPNDPKPVLLPNELQLVTELGLGRGVDGTSPTPWLKRTAFQVRKVAHKTIVGSDESGSVQKYVREVTNVRSQQSTLKASIDVPKAPVTIGVDSEYSRTFTRSRKSVGIRVHNRTISFTSDFDDVSDWMFRDPLAPPPIYDWNCAWPTYLEVSGEKGKPEKVDMGGEREEAAAGIVDSGGDREKAAMGTVKVDTEQPPQKVEVKLTFEERMCKWILDEINNPEKVASDKETRGETGGVRGETKGSPGDEEVTPPAKGADGEGQRQTTPTSVVEEFTQFLEDKNITREIIDPHCRKFINYFRVTHYVSAIQLGAVSYEIMDEKEYKRKIGGSTTVAVEKIAELDFSSNVNWTRHVKETALSHIGVMRKDPIKEMVVRREEEAVIGAQIKPLSSLIRHPLLRESLQSALKSYMDNVQDDREGPFYIACDDDRIFLKVIDPSDESAGAKSHLEADQPSTVTGAVNEVVGVENYKEASPFYIVPTYDSKHPHEFAIAYYSKKAYRDVNPVPRYLDTSTGYFGTNNGPLKVKFGVNEHNCRLTLHDRISSDYEAGDITPWVTGEEAFYIHCARRFLRWNGYIYVRREERTGRRVRYVTACANWVRKHDDESNKYKVFRLIRPVQFRSESVNEGAETPSEGATGVQKGKTAAAIKHTLSVPVEIEYKRL